MLSACLPLPLTLTAPLIDFFGFQRPPSLLHSSIPSNISSSNSPPLESEAKKAGVRQGLTAGYPDVFSSDSHYVL